LNPTKLWKFNYEKAFHIHVTNWWNKWGNQVVMKCFHNCHVELVKGELIMQLWNVFIIVKWMTSIIVMVMTINGPYICFIQINSNYYHHKNIFCHEFYSGNIWLPKEIKHYIFILRLSKVWLISFVMQWWGRGLWIFFLFQVINNFF